MNENESVIENNVDNKPPKKKKMDYIVTTTGEFLKLLRDTENIFFDILELEDKGYYGLTRCTVAELALQIDNYNEDPTTPIKIHYRIKRHEYKDDKEKEEEEKKEKTEEEKIRDKRDQLFGELYFDVFTVEDDRILNSVEFRKLFDVFREFFFESYGPADLIDYMYDISKTHPARPK